MLVVTIIGARPQFIKAGSVSNHLRKHFDEIIIHTGQHYDYEMSKIFFEQLNIPEPNFNLEIGSGLHSLQTGNMMIKIEQKLNELNPDLVLVYGDTNSTLAASLSAVKLKIPVAHIEAGLRNYNLDITEEVNRIVSDHVSKILFAPTENAVLNLQKEGLSSKTVLSGDVMYDSFLQIHENALKSSIVIDELNLHSGNYILATIHRAENTDNTGNLSNILLSFQNAPQKVVFPVHPRTLKTINNNFPDVLNYSNIIYTEPKGYIDFMCLMHNSNMVITDSGGLQKEAYFMKKPCLTIFESSPWIETIESGWNVLCIAVEKDILHKITNFKVPKVYNNYFGNGNAGDIIINAIKNYLNKRF